MEHRLLVCSGSQTTDLLAALQILKAVLNILACETAWAEKGTGEIVSMRESEEREVTFVICEASTPPPCLIRALISSFHLQNTQKKAICLFGYLLFDQKMPVFFSKQV